MTSTNKSTNREVVALKRLGPAAPDDAGIVNPARAAGPAATVSRMGDPIQGSDQHNRRLDEDVTRDPGDVEEEPEVSLWDRPGRDDVISGEANDPDRTDLRSEIGQYTSLVAFPARTSELTAAAESGDASDEVLSALRGLDPNARFESPQDLWKALDLGTGSRF
jgi:uncharacterized protein DUF2795